MPRIGCCLWRLGLYLMLPFRPRGKKPETMAMTSCGVLMKAKLLASAGTMVVVCRAEEQRVSKMKRIADTNSAASKQH